MKKTHVIRALLALLTLASLLAQTKWGYGYHPGR